MGSILQTALEQLRQVSPPPPTDAATVAAHCGLPTGAWHLVQLTIEGGWGRDGHTTGLFLYAGTDEDADEGLYAVLFGGVWCSPYDCFARPLLDDWHQQGVRQCQAQLLCDSVFGDLP